MKRRGGFTLAQTREKFWRGWPAPKERPIKNAPAQLCIHANEYLPHIGFGTVISQLAIHLDRLGVRVGLTCGRIDESHEKIPEAVKPILGRNCPRGIPTIFLGSPHATPPRCSDLIWFTMWETDRIGPVAVKALNRARLVIVPSKFCRDVFLECGVDRVEIAPLGVDTSTFYPLQGLPHDGIFRVGTAGRMHHGGARKGLDLVAKAFTQANLPTRAELHIKCWEDDELALPDDPRIIVNRESLCRAALADWYRSLDLFVLATHGEGWGLQALEAMACGVPVAVTNWSGVLDFWDESCGWPIEYTLEPSTAKVYQQNGGGCWAVPQLGDIVMAMELCSREPQIERRVNAAARAREFPWIRSAKALRGLLVASESIPRKPRKPLGENHCEPCQSKSIQPVEGAT